MANNWDKWKKADHQGAPTGKPQGRKIGGNYACQFCNKSCREATYFPADSVLRYVCPDDHENFLENFKLAW